MPASLRLVLRPANPQPVAAWVHEMDFTAPVLLDDFRLELVRYSLEVTQPQIHKGVEPAVAGVLREEEADITPRNAEEERERRAKAMLELDLEAETPVPGGCR